MMAELSRRNRICQQAPPVVTGLDFLQVVDHTTQDVLHVYFLADPGLVVNQADPTDRRFPNADTGNAADTAPLRIFAPETGETVDITGATWIEVPFSDGDTRQVLEVTVASPGSAARYVFSYTHDYMDRFFDQLAFSFKQGCPSGTDCKPGCGCPEDTLSQPTIDYLARDFSSLRGALLDYAAQSYPEWEARVEADQAMMLLEILAHLGDELAYTQDRYAAEAYLTTATQRRSVAALARLVDYEVDHGASARTELAFGVDQPGVSIRRAEGVDGGTPGRVFALRDDVGAIPFEPLEDVWLHEDWNEIGLYLADSAAPCLPIGATSAYLQSGLPAPGDVPGDVLPVQAPQYWVGRRMVLRSGRGEPDEPNRSWATTITAVQTYEDPLNAAVPLCRVTWDDADALPFEMPIAHAKAYLNIVPVIAGETIATTFRIGSDDDVLAAIGVVDAAQERALRALPQAIEREGACADGGRGVVLRFGMQETTDQGLGWEGAEGGQVPLLDLYEITPDTTIADQIDFEQPVAAQQWDFVESIVSADAEDRAFSLEHGMWREVARFYRPEGDVVLGDYASGDGFTLRFGDRSFGIAPQAGTVFRVRYLTAPGRVANLPADSVVHLAKPGEAQPFAPAIWVTNPFAITSARGPEPVEQVRLNAPEEFRAVILRAVQSEDYREILERRDDIQQAAATPRWTGSWMTDIVAVDPVGSNRLEPALRDSVAAELDCVRQAGRSVCLRDPAYVPIDLKAEICLEPSTSNARMMRRITAVLAKGAAAYFHPDNFTFGTPLIRSSLEAAIQCVPGVRAVESLSVRKRGWHDFQPMPARLVTAPHQIFQLANDPDRPEQGFLEISVHGGG